MKVTMIRLRIAVEQRWGVGRVANADEEIHLPAVVDPRSKPPVPYLPASGLAGALRRHLGQEAGPYWLGPEPAAWEEGEEGEGERRRERSRLALLGTRFEPADGGASAPRTRAVTSIDPERGAAQPRGLRKEQWNPPGVVTVAMELDAPFDESRFDALLAGLTSWSPVIGRAASTGMGASRVKEVTHLSLDLDRDDQFTWWLNHRNAWYRHAEPEPPPAVAISIPGSSEEVPGKVWSVAWRVREPLHVGDDDTSTDSSDQDGPEVLTTMAIAGDPVIPGSSWKGLIRSRVAVILALLDEPRSDDILAWLFGSPQNGRGLLRCQDSLIDRQSLPGGRLRVRTHVSIDRFTGGARDGALFKVEAVPEDTAITLCIRSDEDLPQPVRNLLSHVFWDLHEGIIGLGGMVTRGYGGLRLDPEPGRPDPVDVEALLELLAPAEPKTQEAR